MLPTLAALFCLTGLPATAADLTGQWTLTTLDGTEVAFAATLDLSEQGRLSGMGPCNSYSGRLTTTAASFLPGPILATKRACDGMADENRYLQALQMVDTATLADENLTLTLTLTGEQVLVFTRAPD